MGRGGAPAPTGTGSAQAQSGPGRFAVTTNGGFPPIEESVRLRQFGSVVRLEVEPSMPDRIRDILVSNLGLAPYQVFTKRTSVDSTQGNEKGTLRSLSIGR